MLVCDVCGGKKLVKKGDIFVCADCGVGFSKEELIKKANRGNVPANIGNAAVPNRSSVGNASFHNNRNGNLTCNTGYQSHAFPLNNADNSGAAKSSGRIGKIVSAVVSVFILVFIWNCIDNSLAKKKAENDLREQQEAAEITAERARQEEQNAPSQTSEAAEQSIEFVPYDMNKVLDEFEDNALAANEKYHGVYMVGSLRIRDFGKSFFTNIGGLEDYDAVMVTAPDSQYVFPTIKIALAEGVYDKVLKYHKDDVAVMYLKYVGLSSINEPEFILYDIE